MSDRVYIFLDESGNLDFGPRGTRYFVLTSVSMRRSFEINYVLDSYAYDCIENGIDLEYFHCYNDTKRVRRCVFDLISKHLDAMTIDCLVIEKPAVSATLTMGESFYPTMFARLIEIAQPAGTGDADSPEVVVISDTVPINRGRRAVEKSIQTTLLRALPRVRHRILHHQSRSHYGLQIADYCSWAIFRKWASGDDTWYEQIQSAIRREHTILDRK